MRAPHFPLQAVGWRWAPCAGFVAGALAFVGLALIAIPDRIGSSEVHARSSSLGAALTRVDVEAEAETQSALPRSHEESAPHRRSHESAAKHVQTAGVARTEEFPRRGFSPPLERPEPPAPSAPPDAPVTLEAVKEGVPPPVEATAVPAPPSLAPPTEKPAAAGDPPAPGQGAVIEEAVSAVRAP